MKTIAVTLALVVCVLAEDATDGEPGDIADLCSDEQIKNSPKPKLVTTWETEEGTTTAECLSYDTIGIWWGETSMESINFAEPRKCAHGKGVFLVRDKK